MSPAPEKPLNLPRRLLDIDTIYHEPSIESFPRAVEILNRFPEAQRIEVPSHWKIPGLHGNEGNGCQLFAGHRSGRFSGRLRRIVRGSE